MARIRPYLGTISGIVLGIVTIIIWMLTYNVHPGVDYSRNLFPLSCFVLKQKNLYSSMYIPYALWYWAAFLNWFLPGVCVDLVRWAFRSCRRSQENRKAFGRAFALLAIGWAIMMPACLFRQGFNDSESKRLEQLARDIQPESQPYNAAASNALISVPKYRLEEEKAEVHKLADLQHRRFNEFAAAVSVSSASIIAFSVYTFRRCKH